MEGGATQYRQPCVGNVKIVTIVGYVLSQRQYGLLLTYVQKRRKDMVDAAGDERWFNMQLNIDGVCNRCPVVDGKKDENEPYVLSAANSADPGEVLQESPCGTHKVGVGRLKLDLEELFEIIPRAE